MDLLAQGRATIKETMTSAPLRPGVYRMWDKKGQLLYVGKAKHLRKRLAHYCRRGAHHARLTKLISRTQKCDYIITRNEAEALLLESNLIKGQMPHFNILLRDDKSYPFIHVSPSNDFARLRLHRGARKGDGHFFGPFATTHAVRETLELLERAFLLRSCPDTIFNNRSRPCLLYQIKRCTAPCVGKISKKNYDKRVQDTLAFLEGKDDSLRTKLKKAMNKASEQQNYEEAALYRDRIIALSKLEARQSVTLPHIKDADVFALAREGGASCVEVFFFRGGRHNGNQSLLPRHSKDDSDNDILEAVISQFYAKKEPPAKIIVSHTLGDKHLLADALSMKSSHKVRLHHAQRGELRAVIDHARTNAHATLIRNLNRLEGHDYHQALGQLLGLAHSPSRIEIYDNSHFRGAHPLGVMVVADETGFLKNDYRKFNIKGGGDDTAMMREILTRRLKRLMMGESSFATMPSLIILDGGKAQLNVGAQCLADCGLSDKIALVAIAKGKEGRSGFETLYSWSHAPISMKEHSPLFAYLRRLRDEAHRFAIGAHRHKYSQDVSRSQLDAIPHIGHKRKKALLEHFGDVRTIQSAAIEDLRQCAGISHANAKTIFEWFHES